MSKKVLSGKSIFSPYFSGTTRAKKVSAMAVFTALSVVTNMFLEIRILDIQFSLTIFFSAITGIVLGPIAGFFTCVAGDFIGYLFNSWGQLYMPWVGISTGFFSLFAGIISSFDTDNVWKRILKGVLYVFLTFAVCTVAINSSGFYLYNKYVTGFTAAFDGFAASYLGGNSGFFAYLAYRLIFKGQIWNSVANYALLFSLLPFLKKLIGARFNEGNR